MSKTLPLAFSSLVPLWLARSGTLKSLMTTPFLPFTPDTDINLVACSHSGSDTWTVLAERVAGLGCKSCFTAFVHGADVTNVWKLHP
jgi:hypothetical protein